MTGARAKRLDWGRRALDAYIATLIHIASEDRRTAELVEGRVDRALKMIVTQPGIGTSSSRRNERIFAIPRTGHVIHFRVFARAIRITLWYRARQRVRR